MLAWMSTLANIASSELTGFGSGAGAAVLVMAGKWAFTRRRANSGNGRLPCNEHGERLARQETSLVALAKLVDERTQRIEKIVETLVNRDIK